TSDVFFLIVSAVFHSFFFFQAEDGIRDRNVTGVQTCALPISGAAAPGCPRSPDPREVRRECAAPPGCPGGAPASWQSPPCRRSRSEERRVGKECRSRRGANYYKKAIARDVLSVGRERRS